MVITPLETRIHGKVCALKSYTHGIKIVQLLICICRILDLVKSSKVDKNTILETIYEFLSELNHMTVVQKRLKIVCFEVKSTALLNTLTMK